MKIRGSICKGDDVGQQLTNVSNFLEDQSLVEKNTCEIKGQIDEEGCFDWQMECIDTEFSWKQFADNHNKKLPAKFYVPLWKRAGIDKPFPKPMRPSYDKDKIEEIEGSIHAGGTSLEDVVPPFTFTWTKDWGTTLMADVKYRGNRGLVVIHDNDVEIYSTSLQRMNALEKKYKDIILSELPEGLNSAVMDTELYVLDKSTGEPVEQGLQTGYIRVANRSECGVDCELKLEIFDIQVINDKDVRNESIVMRKRILDQIIDNEGVLQAAEMNYIPNTIESLRGQLIEDRQHRREGSVLKRLDPKQMSEYFIGKDGSKWIKQKVADTLDLEVKRLELHPNPLEGKSPFGYRRMILTPSDDREMEIPIANSMQGFHDTKWWVRKTADLYEKALDKGWKMSPGKAPITDTLGGRLPPELPLWIEIPAGEEVVEIYAEDISSDLGISSPKLVAFRGKKRAETKKDIESTRRLFYRK